MINMPNNKDIVIPNDDKLEIKLLFKQIKILQKGLRIYKGKNKTKRRRYLSKKSKIDCIKNQIHFILYPYAEKIFNTQITPQLENEHARMFSNFADVSNFGEACTFDILKINDFGISKKIFKEKR